MRIVLLSSYESWHGGEVVLAALAEGLAARGHDVTLLCRSASALAERAGATGVVRVVTSRLRGEVDPRAHAGVLRALQAARADVLLTNLSRDLKFGAVAARILGVPHVHRFAQVARQDVPPSSGRDGLVKPGKRATRILLGKWVAGCITPSFFVRDLLRARFPEARHVAVIHNGVDVARFRPDPEAGLRWRAARGLGASELIVGCVGVLNRKRKAQQILIQAAALARQRPRLVFVGTGRDEASLRELAGELGVEALFAGFEADVGAAYNAFDVVALPSRLEAFGLAAAEAMASGRPVVAAHAASIPEIVGHGTTGWLVPVDDPVALASAIDTLVTDPALRGRLGTAARAHIRDHFSVEVMLERYERALEAARDGSFGSFVAGDAPALAGARRRPRTLRKRIRLALRGRRKRSLYPLLALGRGPTVAPEEVELGRCRRILLLREMNTLGDALVATPAVRALALAHPRAELAMVAGWRNAAVWAESPRLARVFVLERGRKAMRLAGLVREIRDWAPDACLTLVSLTCSATLDALARGSAAPLRIRYDGAVFGAPHTNVAYTCLVEFPRPAPVHQVDVCAGVLRPFGVEMDDRRLELEPGPEAERKAAAILVGLGIEPGGAFVVVHPGSKQVHNRWPLERFASVYRHCVLKRGLRTLLSLGPSERETPERFTGAGVDRRDLLPEMDLATFAALLRSARLVICPDTGVLHVAAAVGAPVVGIYGSGAPEVWRPPGPVRAVTDHVRGNVRRIAVEPVLREVDAALAEAAQRGGSQAGTGRRAG